MNGLPASTLLSVVIPCYNQAHFLAEAIESVLAQDYANTELVVIDDGSTDNTAEVAAGYPDVRCVQQGNRGLSAARNAGMRHSRGAYLVFLDADDRLLPGALSTGIRHLQTSPESAFVAGGLQVMNDDGTPRDKQRHPPVDADDYYRVLLTGNHIWTPATVIFRRSSLVDVGGFDEDLSACEDYDAYLRLTHRYSAFCHDSVVAEYRKYTRSMSGDAEMMLKSAMTVLQRQLPRIEGSPRLQVAYEQGLSHWREVYGPQITGQIKEHIRTPGKRLSGLRKVATLMRHAPWWLARYSVQKAMNLSIPFVADSATKEKNAY